MVLSHGFAGGPAQMVLLAGVLRQAGFDAHSVGYSGRILSRDVAGYARELSGFVDSLGLGKDDTLDLILS